MAGLDTRIAQWITKALLAPAWWGMGLMALAVFADLFPRQRERVSAIFNRLERTRRERPTDDSSRVAA